MIFQHSRSYLMHQLDQLEFSIFFPDQKCPNSTVVPKSCRNKRFMCEQKTYPARFVPGTKVTVYVCPVRLCSPVRFMCPVQKLRFMYARYGYVARYVTVYVSGIWCVRTPVNSIKTGTIPASRILKPLWRLTCRWSPVLLNDKAPQHSRVFAIHGCPQQP